MNSMFSGRSRARRVIVSPAALATVLFLFAGGCVMVQPAFAAAHLTVYVQPYGVDLSTQGAMAVGEVVPVEVRGALADAQVTNWLGAVTRGTNVVGVCTNLVMGTNGVAVGSVDCATAEMGALFVGAGPLAERDVMLTFAEKFNDAGDYRLVASGSATVRNNPLSADAIAGFAPTGRHLWDSPLFDAIRDWIDAEYTTALSAHVSDTNNPHRVTLEQLNQSDELGTLLFAYGINAWLNEGLKWITWTDHRVDLESGTFYGAWNFSTYPPTYEGAKLLTTNDIAPSFTNGTAPSLILSGIPYSRIVNDGLLSLPGVFYVGEPYDQLFVKPAGETASILTLSQDMAQFSKDLRVLQNLSADSFTLDGSTNKLEVLDGELTYGGEPIGNGQGSGFPLTNNADFASFSATNVGSIQLAGSTNELAVEDGRLRWGGKSVAGVANLTAGRNIELSTNETTEAVTVATTDDVSFDDVQVRGNLTIYGQQIHNTIIRNYTNINVGVFTNYITYDHYQTNNIYTYVNEVSRTTNHVDEVVNVGGDVDHSKAASIATPSYTIDNSDTNHPLLAATGEWDFTLASINFGSNLPDLSDYATQGWVESYHASHTPDLTGLATEFWVSSQLAGYAQKEPFEGVSNRVNTIEQDYITSDDLDDALEDYAPKSEITVIATNIEEIVSALSNPVIQTPDRKKWTMQGRYSGGKVTHIWVPYIGVYSSPFRVSMPDGRIFEMAGRYADGNTNIVTHVWMEVVE